MVTTKKIQKINTHRKIERNKACHYKKINQNIYKDSKRCWDQKKKNKAKHNKIATAKSSLSITTLDINKLNSLIKSEWLKKKIPTRCCLNEPQLRFKDMYMLKLKSWQKISIQMVTSR